MRALGERECEGWLRVVGSLPNYVPPGRVIGEDRRGGAQKRSRPSNTSTEDLFGDAELAGVALDFPARPKTRLGEVLVWLVGSVTLQCYLEYRPWAYDTTHPLLVLLSTP